MEKIFPTDKLLPTLLWPVTGLTTGTPVLIRKLTAPQRERRAEAATLKAEHDKLAAEAAKFDEAAFAKKLAEADPAKRPAMLHARETARVTAEQFDLEQAKADRKATRSRLGDAAGAAALMLVVGGPLVWSLVGPWIEPGIGLLLGGWWIAALIHAPAPAPSKGTKAGATEDQGEEDDQADEEEDDQEEEYRLRTPAAPATPRELSAAELTTSVEHMVALRAQTDEGRGHVHLAEALETFQRHGLYPDADARAFGALVRAAGLPVEPGIRVPGRTPSTGFTATSLATHLRRSPALPPQAAAQAAVDHTPQAA
ncbi:hypothetical protein [Kitasatospora sp. NPDC088779]|uniref:hypothetical protein n=1 Tax=Kitasatospora sp. NPDC088779 TaxID=3154964 RepID=UPI003441CEED